MASIILHSVWTAVVKITVSPRKRKGSSALISNLKFQSSPILLLSSILSPFRRNDSSGSTKNDSLNQSVDHRRKEKEVDVRCDARSQAAKIFNLAFPRVTANTGLRFLSFQGSERLLAYQRVILVNYFFWTDGQTGHRRLFAIIVDVNDQKDHVAVLDRLHDVFTFRVYA